MASKSANPQAHRHPLKQGLCSSRATRRRGELTSTSVAAASSPCRINKELLERLVVRCLLQATISDVEHRNGPVGAVDDDHITIGNVPCAPMVGVLICIKVDILPVKPAARIQAIVRRLSPGEHDHLPCSLGCQLIPPVPTCGRTFYPFVRHPGCRGRDRLVAHWVALLLTPIALCVQRRK